MDGGILDEINASLASEEAQWFEQVRIFDPTCVPKVWHRLLGADFMAEASVLKPGNANRRRFTGTGKSIDLAMQDLASNLAAYLFPDKRATPPRR